MLGSLLRTAVIAALVSCAAGGGAFACACCANQGERYDGRRALETYEKVELAKVEPATEAHLSLSEAGLDEVKGIVKPSEALKVALAKTALRWTFTFTAPDGRVGRLSLPSPRFASFFEIDPRISFDPAEKQPAQVVTVWLYKEWRFTHPLDASGFFSSDRTASFTLILHGRGNHCLSAEQFTHWTILAKGRNTRYTLYGELGPPSSKE